MSDAPAPAPLGPLYESPIPAVARNVYCASLNGLVAWAKTKDPALRRRDFEPAAARALEAAHPGAAGRKAWLRSAKARLRAAYGWERKR